MSRLETINDLIEHVQLTLREWGLPIDVQRMHSLRELVNDSFRRMSPEPEDLMVVGMNLVKPKDYARELEKEICWLREELKQANEDKDYLERENEKLTSTLRAF